MTILILDDHTPSSSEGISSLLLDICVRDQNFFLRAFIDLFFSQIDHDVPKTLIRKENFLLDLYSRLTAEDNAKSVRQIVNECVDLHSEHLYQKVSDGPDLYSFEAVRQALLETEKNVNDPKTNLTVKSSNEGVNEGTCATTLDLCTVNPDAPQPTSAAAITVLPLFTRRSSITITSISNRTYRRTDPRGENPLYRRRRLPYKRFRRSYFRKFQLISACSV